MNPNLTAYYWAEQANRQRLSGQAARGWLAAEAAAAVPGPKDAGALRRATGSLLVRIGARLQGSPVPGTERPLAALGGAR